MRPAAKQARRQPRPRGYRCMAYGEIKRAPIGRKHIQRLPPPVTVTCESINHRERVCSVPRGPVTLVRQLSSRNCIKGESWGFNRRNNTIWVRNGCRAEFRVA